MDIYRFLDSNDIRAHLQSLRYDFTLSEAAFLVWQCATAPLSEKHDAWRELIQTMPDCRMERRRNMCEIQSMHGFLQEYIELEEKLLRDFYRESDAVYFYSVLLKDEHFPDGFSESEKYERAFPTLSDCLAAVEKDMCDNVAEDILHVCIKRQLLSDPNRFMTVCLNNRLEVMDIDAFHSPLTKREQELLGAFEGMWFAFPTPFKRGDLVCQKHSLKAWRFPQNACYVLESIAAWTNREMQESGFLGNYSNTQDMDRLHQMLLKDGDVTDMSFSAYSVEDGKIVFDNVGWYLSLERFDGTLTGAQRALYPLRDLLNGKIRPDMFLDALRVLRADEETKNTAGIRENLLYHKDMSYISAENAEEEACEKEETL